MKDNRAFVLREDKVEEFFSKSKNKPRKMAKEKVHDLMENELRCIQMANYCDRDCAKCFLVKEDKELIDAYTYVIKALEQEPVLDKIRAEIEELDRYYDNDYFSTNNCPMYKCNEVLQIIDKYKAEMESEE